VSTQISSAEAIILKVGQRGDWLIVLLHTANGMVGLGEASQSTNDQATSACVYEFGRVLQNRKIENIPSIVEELRASAHDHFAAVALSGIEQALWDVAGQVAGLPLAELLGGSHHPEVSVYANINRGTVDRSPDGFAASAKRAVHAGFRAIKCSPFDGVEFTSCREPGAWAKIALGIERASAVRDAIGTEVELMVDCLYRFDGLLALQVATALKPLRLAWLEDPVMCDDLDGLRLVRTRADIPLATGEQLHQARSYWPLLREHLVDYLLPDVKHCGGVGSMLEIGHAASIAGIGIAPHNPSGPISTLVSAHILATMSNAVWLEFATAEVSWRAELLEPQERTSKEGAMRIPHTPGLGARLNAAVVEAHRK